MDDVFTHEPNCNTCLFESCVLLDNRAVLRFTICLWDKDTVVWSKLFIFLNNNYRIGIEFHPNVLFCSNWQLTVIGSRNGVVPSRRHVIIRNNDDPDLWHIFESPSTNEVNKHTYQASSAWVCNVYVARWTRCICQCLIPHTFVISVISESVICYL